MTERVGPVLAAVVIVVALVALLPSEDDSSPAAPRPANGPSAVDAFLAAYERSRTVEVVVESTFTRTFPDGRELAYEQRLVQRPPDDRLVIGAGSASGRIDGRVVRCNATPSGPPDCVQGDDARPYDEEVAAEIADLAGLVEPDDGAYAVTAGDDGCFDLALEVRILTPPYGVAATFCFDDESGALSVLDIERPEATDRTVADAIRTEVTAADLRAAELGDPVSTGSS